MSLYIALFGCSIFDALLCLTFAIIGFVVLLPLEFQQCCIPQDACRNLHHSLAAAKANAAGMTLGEYLDKYVIARKDPTTGMCVFYRDSPFITQPDDPSSPGCPADLFAVSDPQRPAGTQIAGPRTRRMRAGRQLRLNMAILGPPSLFCCLLSPSWCT